MKSHDVDNPVGRAISRREAVEKLSLAGTALLAAACGPHDITGLGQESKCPLRPAIGDDSFFVDENLQRTDIRSDTSSGTKKAGSDLKLSMTIYKNVNDECTPIEGAQVDVWHCDTRGIYSDVVGDNYNTVGQNFLRGFQLTNQAGTVEFTTIVPGWEQHRATHISFKIRNVPGATAGYEFASQLFFNEDFLSYVYRSPTYGGRNEAQRVRNDADLIYKGNGGILLLLTPESLSNGGFSAEIVMGLVL